MVFSCVTLFETDSDGDSGEEESGCGYVEEEDSDLLGNDDFIVQYLNTVISRYAILISVASLYFSL